ncbi:hypothetical protein ACJ4V0_20770 [Phreatobacter sp. HK31-P]
MLIRAFLVAIAVLGTFANPAFSQAQCRFDPQKAERLRFFLCGGTAPEPEYRMTGPGCIQRSMSARLSDTAIQAHIYRLCGDAAFADRLLEGVRGGLRPLEMLAVCAGEPVNVARMLEQQIASAATRLAGASCNAELRSISQQKKPELERNTAFSLDPANHRTIFERLGVLVDSGGNIRDR